MSKKAQAGVEYLLSYGWALILVVTVIGVLLFVVSGPNQDILFRSSDPTKILLKGATALGDAIQIKLQNITGGKITITALDSSDYSNITLNGQTLTQASPVEISAGGEMILEGTGTTGSISITYTDFANIERTVTITGGGAEEEGPAGTPISMCQAISEPGSYYLAENITPSSFGEDCITINAGNVILDCDGKTITANSGGDYGIVFWSFYENVTVENCTITGFEKEIQASGDNCTISGNSINGGWTGIYVSGDGCVVSGNTVTGAGEGIALVSSDPGNVAVTGNTLTGNTTGIYSYEATNNTISGNTANSNGTGIYLTGCHNNTVENNTVNSNTDQGIALDNAYSLGNTVSGNTACGNGGKDLVCTAFGSVESGTGNAFDGVIACPDGSWPLLGVHYNPCP